MSHKEYCAQCDEEQLLSLIEHAKKRIDDLKAEGWINVWVVADYCNRAWFPQDQYWLAVETMIEYIRKEKESKAGGEWSVRPDRMRPSEAAVLLKRVGVAI